MKLQLFDFSFPSYSFRLREDKVREIWDIARKQWVKFTPEEYVRQHAVHYFHFDLKFSLGLMGIEKALLFHGMSRRPDLVLYTQSAVPFLIAEFKSPEVRLTADVLNQALRYHSVLGAQFLFLSNGHEHALCEVLPGHQGTWLTDAESWKRVQAIWEGKS